MKTIWTTIFVLFIVWSLPAQIFEGYENWQANGDYFIPQGWEVNLDWCIIQEEEAFEGQFAMRLRSLGPSFEGYAPGVASRIFFVPEEATGISFAVLVDSLFEGGSARLNILDNQEEVIASWESNELNAQYQEVNLPFDADFAGDSIKIECIANTTIGPLGFDGYAEMVVDKLSWLTTNSIEEETTELSIQLFPNPAKSIVQVQSSKRIKHLVLYNLIGRPVQRVQMDAHQAAIVVEHLPKGSYLLQLTMEDDQLLTRRLVIN